MSFAEALDILYEDNHCLALNKPAGWPTTHFDGQDETVDRLAKSYLKEKYHKPGNVFLGVVHRLDKPVSGALLFARTSKAAARLSEQFREGVVEKVYWAVVENQLATDRLATDRLATDRLATDQLATDQLATDQLATDRLASGRLATDRLASGRREPAVPWDTTDSGSLEDWLKKDEPNARVEVVPPETTGAQFARLLFTVLGRHERLTWLELRPHTGRKHQLRVQLSSRGSPIYGDAKYGSNHPFGHAIALHARSLTFLHPITKEPVTVVAEVPKLWRGRFAHLLASGAA